MQLEKEKISCILLAHLEGSAQIPKPCRDFASLPKPVTAQVCCPKCHWPSCPLPGCLGCQHCSQGFWGADLEFTVLLLLNMTLRQEMQYIIYYFTYYCICYSLTYYHHHHHHYH